MNIFLKKNPIRVPNSFKYDGRFALVEYNLWPLEIKIVKAINLYSL